jgi:hypothetical protein
MGRLTRAPMAQLSRVDKLRRNLGFRGREPAGWKLSTRWLAAACVCGIGLSTAEAVERTAAASRAVSELREAVAELRREEKSYRAFRSSAKKDKSELEAYAAFIAALQLRVFEQCEVVRAEAGEEAVREFDCVAATPHRPGLVIVPPGAVQTEEEKRATLNARLNAIEGELDESLQKRQQEIRQKQAASTAGGGAGSSAASGGRGAGGGGSTGAKDGAAGTAGQPADSTGQTDSTGGSTGAQQHPRSAAYGRPGKTDAPVRQQPIDGASDDDIVARQLREAAEKETDPVLKEKLWAEYKKYREAKR